MMLAKNLDQRLVNLFVEFGEEHFKDEMNADDMKRVDVIEALLASVQKCFTDPEFLQFFIKREV